MTSGNGADNANAFTRGGLFIFDAEPIIEWPVIVHYPMDGGKSGTAEIPMEFRAMPMSEVAEIEEALAKIDRADIGGPDDPLMPVVLGWRGMGRDKVEGEVPCDAENRALLLRRTNVRAAILTALREIALGAEAKNSGTPRGDGPNRAMRRAAAAQARTGSKPN